MIKMYTGNLEQFIKASKVLDRYFKFMGNLCFEGPDIHL
jgi:hypothetical protein